MRHLSVQTGITSPCSVPLTFTKASERFFSLKTLTQKYLLCRPNSKQDNGINKNWGKTMKQKKKEKETMCYVEVQLFGN